MSSVESTKVGGVSSKKPEVPPGKILVEAVHAGYRNAMDIEKGECFLIPIEPLNKETGLPLAYSDHRKTVAPGRSGWMKPVDAVEEKKLLDLEAAFKKGKAAAAPAAPKGEGEAPKGEGEPPKKPQGKPGK